MASPMKLVTHSGGCCGVHVIYNFGFHGPDARNFESENAYRAEGHQGGPVTMMETRVEALDRLLLVFDNTYGDQRNVQGGRGTGGARIVEVCLNERQVGAWRQPLLDRGFFEAFDFANRNSGLRVYMFFRYVESDARTINMSRALRPMNREQIVQINARPAVPPAAVVATEYYAHLQNGGRRGPFDSRGGVRLAYPRVRRIDRRLINSDGTSTWQIAEG